MLKQSDSSQKMEKKSLDGVYYVFSSKDNTVLLAFDVEINDDVIRWFDTIKERVMRATSIMEENINKFVFQRAEEEGGGIYIFMPLNLEIYREKVKDRLLSGREFEDEEQMFAAIKKTKESAW